MDRNSERKKIEQDMLSQYRITSEIFYKIIDLTRSYDSQYES